MPKTLDEIIKEIKSDIYASSEVKGIVHQAIEQAFEAVELGSRDEESGYDKEAIGYNTALTQIKELEEKFLNK